MEKFKFTSLSKQARNLFAIAFSLAVLVLGAPIVAEASGYIEVYSGANGYIETDLGVIKLVDDGEVIAVSVPDDLLPRAHYTTINPFSTTVNINNWSINSGYMSISTTQVARSANSTFAVDLRFTNGRATGVGVWNRTSGTVSLFQRTSNVDESFTILVTGNFSPAISNNSAWTTTYNGSFTFN